ncbi:MAG TPA: UbiX family flavin prenyltransferase [Hyphomicrobiaceae bacterium]|nr:UbiX family flavin prenyltransferase [Hyphomicrobiaceae bacterium]
MSRQRVVLGISGASGAAIGLRIAEILGQLPEIETHLVISPAAERTLAIEIGPDAIDCLERCVARRHPNNDIGAEIASGSVPTVGMIVAPCSMRTLSSIAAGITDNLLVRAADVHLKERRPLILVARESPLHLGHLRAMAAVSEFGAIVAPPVPAFYLRPERLADVVEQIALRTIGLLRLHSAPPPRAWSVQGP